jgi:hypothetical protein
VVWLEQWQGLIAVLRSFEPSKKESVHPLFGFAFGRVVFEPLAGKSQLGI